MSSVDVGKIMQLPTHCNGFGHKKSNTQTQNILNTARNVLMTLQLIRLSVVFWYYMILLTLSGGPFIYCSDTDNHKIYFWNTQNVSLILFFHLPILHG